MKLIQTLILLFIATNFTLGQFETNYIHFANSYANRNKIYDIDNDGDLDYLSSRDSSIIYKLNNGTGEFGEIIVKSTNSDIQNIVVFDFDQDGLNDIIFNSFDNYYYKWFKNLGNGNYSSSIQLFYDSTPIIDLYGIDIDNDGDTDLVKAYNLFSGTFSIRENLGNLTFGPDIVINTGSTDIAKLKFYDINQDGLLDAVYSAYDMFGNWKYAFSKNLGNSTFGPEIIISNTTSSSIEFFAFDFDLDDDLDFFYLNSEDDEIIWHENINSNDFETEQFIQIPNGQNIVSGINMDYDSDGMTDILATVNSKLVGYKNLGGGVFSSSYTIISNNGVFNPIVRDINNDGLDDLFYENSGVYWMKKNGTNTFSSPIGISVGISIARGGIVIDYDGDNKKDLFIIGGATAWNKNKGNNVFETGKTFEHPVPNSNHYIKKVDLNSDGLQDIVTNLYVFNGLGWKRNVGNGQFLDYTSIAGWEAILYQNDFEFGDLDNDGDLDIVITRENYAFRWLKNLGNSQFDNSSTSIPGTTSSYADIELADLNLDGNLDVIYIGDGGISWRENLGNGIFGEALSITTFGARSIKTVDIDQDGLIDVVSASYNDNKLAWYKNLGGSQFGNQQLISTQIINPLKLELGDINCDGKIDIVAANNDEVSWFENFGGGQFSEKSIIADIPGFLSFNLDDIDIDGDLDILITAGLNDTRLLINQFVHNYQISGKLFFDEDQNGIFDNEDVGIPNVSVLSNPSSSYSYSYQNGDFITIFNDTVGTYSIFPEIIENWSITSIPTSYSVDVTSNFVNQANLNFGFYPDTLFNEITPMIFSFDTRCNDTINYWIVLKNTGTLASSGIVELKLDPLVEFYNSNIPFDSVNSNSIYWHFDSLNVFGQIQLNLSVVMPDFQSMGSIIVDSLNVFVLNDNGIDIHEFNVNQSNEITCAYDPNDKTVSPKGITSLGYIPTDTEWLNYVIRFQNTGNDTAQNVRIDDVLDENLEQLTILSSSHSLQTEVDESNKISFIFNNINLPDSNANVLASQGYVAYKAKLKNNLPIGTQITNIANIYFDYNPAIITNSVVNTLHDENSLNLTELENNIDLLIYPNPFNDYVNIELFDKNVIENFYLEVYNTLGQKLIDKVQFEKGKIQLSSSELGNGIILFKLYSESGELIIIKKGVSF